MKKVLIIAMLLCSVAVFAADVDAFVGRWALELPGGAGWLGVTTDDGYLDASLLWYGGSVVPVENVYVDGDKLVVTRMRSITRAKDEDGNATRKHVKTETYTFERLNETTLAGHAYSPRNDATGVDKTTFIGTKIPPIPKAPNLKKLKFGKKINLFV